MKIDELKEYMQDVVKNKGIEIERKQSAGNYYNLSYEHGLNKGHILLATDILKLIEMGEMTMFDKLTKIEEVIVRFGQDDGEHHKAWVIDQVMRIIKGDEYANFVKAYECCDDEQCDDEWCEGIAP